MKDIYEKENIRLRLRENIFKCHIQQKTCIKNYKNLSKLSNLIFKMNKRHEHTLHQGGYNDGKQTQEIRLTPLVIKEMQIKPQGDTTEDGETKNLAILSADKEAKQQAL